jgi:hypothetical protein
LNIYTRRKIVDFGNLKKNGHVLFLKIKIQKMTENKKYRNTNKN